MAGSRTWQGKPIPDALIQVWQTDSDGEYDLQRFNGAEMDTRGNFRADAEGRFHFRTVLPLGYTDPDGRPGRRPDPGAAPAWLPPRAYPLPDRRPGHRELVTALYLGSDQYIDTDTVFGVSRSLVVNPKADPEAPIPGIPAIRYDFRLSAEAAGGSNRVGADPAQIMAAE